MRVFGFVFRLRMLILASFQGVIFWFTSLVYPALTFVDVLTVC